MIKFSENKTSTLFNLDLASNTILSCFFPFFLIIALYVLVPAFITQIYDPNAEPVIPIGIPIKEAKGEIEIHPGTVETIRSKCSIQFKNLQTFLYFLLINSFFVNFLNETVSYFI